MQLLLLSALKLYLVKLLQFVKLCLKLVLLLLTYKVLVAVVVSLKKMWQTIKLNQLLTLLR
ncbi:hypothetical protein D3C75_1281390 [compost metagenome]